MWSLASNHISLQYFHVSEREVAYNLFNALNSGMTATKIPNYNKARTRSAALRRSPSPFNLRPKTPVAGIRTSLPSNIQRPNEQEQLLQIVAKSLQQEWVPVWCWWSKVAKPIGSTSIRNRSDTKVSDRCLIHVDPRGFAMRDVLVCSALSIRYFTVTFLQMNYKRHPIARPWKRVIRHFYEL